jgi:hypothetical protein
MPGRVLVVTRLGRRYRRGRRYRHGDDRQRVPDGPMISSGVKQRNVAAHVSET